MPSTATVGAYAQVSAAEKAAGTETALRSFAPKDVRDMADGSILAYETRQTLTDAATIDYDIVNGPNAKVTLGGDRALADPDDNGSNPVDGAAGHLLIIQDGTGGRALTKPTNMTMVQGDFADIASMTSGQKADLTWISEGSGNTRGWLVVP